MSKVEKDRILLEQLDKLLRSGETEIPESEDTDTRTAVEFARKVALMGESPSSEFRENLKAQLIHRLSEQEKKNETGDYELEYWGLPRRKRWQGTVAALIMVIIIAIVVTIILLVNM